MPETTRARLGRLAALATLSIPVAAGLLLLTPGRALADASSSTITCPKGDGSSGGTTVSGTGHTCGTYADSNQTVIRANIACPTFIGIAQCGNGNPTFAVTSPSGSKMFSKSLGPGKQGSMSYVVPAGSMDGTYTATLTGGGASVSATFELQAAPSAATAPDPAPPTSPPDDVAAPTTGTSAAPTTGTSAAPTAGAASGSTPPTGSSGAPSTEGAAPPSQSGSGPGPTSASGGHGAAIRFPQLPPPAGIAQLAPLPELPKSEPGVPGPYGTTLPYDGSVTVAGRTASTSTLLRHVTDTFDDKQVVESVAAAFLALLLAAHLREFTRRPSGDADL